METTEMTNVSETTVNEQMNAAEQVSVEPQKKSGAGFGKVVMFGAVPGILLGAAGITGAAYAVSDDFDDVVDDFQEAAGDLLGTDDASAAETEAEVEVAVVASGQEEYAAGMGSVVEQLEAILPDPAELMAAMGAEIEPAVVETVANEEVTAEEVATEDVAVEETMPEITGLARAAVSDEMSFGAAFEAARSQVGPEGVFEWRGNYYSTYTKDEWDAMDGAERESYMHKYYDTDMSAEPAAEVEEIVEVDETVEVVDVVEEVEEDVMTVETDEEVVFGEVDGHEAMYMDADGDGMADYMVVDSNDDGEAGYDEVFNIEDEGISMDAVGSAGDIF